MLEEAAKKIGHEMENLPYEKVSDFKYLGATLSTKND